MVGSAGTRQPAESRSHACRRACPAHESDPLFVCRPARDDSRSLPALVDTRQVFVREPGLGGQPLERRQAVSDLFQPDPLQHPSKRLRKGRGARAAKL